jgi:hypothetical protein
MDSADGTAKQAGNRTLSAHRPRIQGDGAMQIKEIVAGESVSRILFLVLQRCKLRVYLLRFLPVSTISKQNRRDTVETNPVRRVQRRS